MHSKSCLELPGVQDHTPGATVAKAPPCHHSGELEPLLVVLLHAYAEAVQKQCKTLVKERLQHHQQIIYGWEEAAQVSAQHQMQWFVDKQLQLIVQYLKAP